MRGMRPMPWHVEPWNLLKGRRERGAMPHALLLAGPAGLGKRLFADRLARALLCRTPADGEACGECKACLLNAAGTHPDRATIGLALRKDGTTRTEVVIDQVRELSQRLAMSSQFGGWQVVTIDPADAMNASAANALLKTLEEPSRDTLLVLVADAPWRLPATIRSRTQRVDFHLPTADVAMAWLAAEGVADAGAALAAANGNPGQARAWSAEGQLKARSEVRNDLRALASGRGDAIEVARRWQAAAPPAYLWFAAQAAAEESRARTMGQEAPLGSALDAFALDTWFASANRAREALRVPLRTDLIMLELLSTWR
jgi:DNA polymerase III subunit delta'